MVLAMGESGRGATRRVRKLPEAAVLKAGPAATSRLPPLPSPLKGDDWSASSKSTTVQSPVASRDDDEVCRSTVCHVLPVSVLKLAVFWSGTPGLCPEGAAVEEGPAGWDEAAVEDEVHRSAHGTVLSSSGWDEASAAIEATPPTNEPDGGATVAAVPPTKPFHQLRPVLPLP